MQTGVRIAVGLLALMFVLTSFQWIVDPTTAAQGLGVTLPGPDEGIARSTIVGDLTAFFVAAAVFLILGLTTGRAHWLLAAAVLFGSAAIMRTAAWAFHGADFAASFIVVEVVATSILVYAAVRAE